MSFKLVWLAEVLDAAGLKFAEVNGWRTRGRAEMGAVRGVMCHHTANRQPGNMPTLGQLINGRTAAPGVTALSGPLAQLGLGRDGTYYVVAAGRANHAGGGSWEGITSGNASFVGIEAENDGVGEAWPAVQIDAYQRGAAAILKKIGASATMCCGHKEYALPPGRKSDPDFDMPLFRKGVAAFLAGQAPAPPIPATDQQQRPTLRRGSGGPLVSQAQALLNIKIDGQFGGGTEAALRQAQRDAGLVPDGILGPKSWELLDALAAAVKRAAQSAPAGAAAPPAQPAAAPEDGVALIAPAVIAMPPSDKGGGSLRLEGRTAIGPDGRRFAVTSGHGFFSNGETSLGAWLDGLQAAPVALSSSVIRVVKAMCANEGDLEAVNSYDDAHLSFGIFQWTAGRNDTAGELAALVAAFAAYDREAFAECFGQFGLGAEVVDETATTGLLKLDDEVLQTSEQKNALRSLTWAYRFWRAGHHPSLRACELAQASRRIELFRTLPVAGLRLNDWLSSELGIALVLDEHVNRPGHVPGTLAKAIRATRSELPSDPATWTSEHENTLIVAYLKQRGETDMTDSGKRAAKISDHVRRDTLSDARGSFVTTNDAE